MSTTTLRPAFLAVLVSVSIGLAQADDDNRSGAFGLSLPSVNDSAIGYGKNVNGAVSDKLYYTLGGGSVISQPATRSSMRKLGMDIGWSSDLMSDVIQGATGAVASLPAMVIQSANPGLYDMLTNGVLQGSVAFDKAQLNCQNMSKRMMNFAGNNKWNQSAVMDEYKSLVNSGDADAVRVNNASEKLQGKSGQNWIGGQKRGGQNQPAIRPTHDLAAAGYNMMNSLPVLSTTPVSNSSCNGGACAKYGSAEEAAKAVVQVVGDSSLRTCGDASQCTSGDDEQQPGATQAGT